MGALVLNLGAGDRPAPAELVGADGTEIRVDMAPPADVIADVRHLPFADDYADAVYASHLIEHFDERDLVPMVAEWRRVLKPGGRMVIECPDIQSVAEKIATDGVDAVLYQSLGGHQIRGQDAIFGYQDYLQTMGDGMRHKVAFDSTKLAATLTAAGCDSGTVRRYPGHFTLIALTVK